MKIRVLTIILVGFFCLAANNCCVSSDADAITKQLHDLEKTISLPYHEDLVKAINHYESKGISGLFVENESFLETELQRRNMPVELKYLPIALTDMRPDYKSGDCRGIWALPSLVALRYGFDVDENIDERLSVESSTQAALDYLSELYQQYGDWWMSILAFTNSPNSLQRAVVQSDKFLDLWDFYDQDLLQNSLVIRDFIACDYVYNAYTAEQKSAVLAKYKESEAKRQKEGIEKVDENQIVTTESIQKPEPIVAKSEKPKDSYTNYKVKRGDTLNKIAKKYHVSVANLKQWNNLKGDMIRDGQNMKIKK